MRGWTRTRTAFRGQSKRRLRRAALTRRTCCLEWCSRYRSSCFFTEPFTSRPFSCPIRGASKLPKESRMRSLLLASADMQKAFGVYAFPILVAALTPPLIFAGIRHNWRCSMRGAIAILTAIAFIVYVTAHGMVDAVSRGHWTGIWRMWTSVASRSPGSSLELTVAALASSMAVCVLVCNKLPPPEVGRKNLSD